jgi:hypothetical protein
MAYQAGQPGIDFGFIGGRGKEFQGYVSAIQAGMRQAYGPMISDSPTGASTCGESI